MKRLRGFWSCRFGLIFATAWVVVLGPAWRAAADVLETADGKIVKGIVRRVADGKLTVVLPDPQSPKAAAADAGAASTRILGLEIKTPTGDAPNHSTLHSAKEQVREIALVDLVHVTFEPILDRSRRHPPLIDNDEAGIGRSRSGRIKLRKGFHRIVIPYWHGAGRPLLRLEYAFREGSKRRERRMAPPSMLFHLEPGQTETPSAGLDSGEYRLPEVLSQGGSQLISTVRFNPAGGHLHSMADLMDATSISSSSKVDRVSAGVLPNESEQISMILSGYIRVPEDGEYTFWLSSDGGSQLYVGDVPSGLRQAGSARPSPPWTIKLAHGGSVAGILERWDDSKARVRVGAGKSAVVLAIPADRVAEIWQNKPLAKDDKIDRTSLPAKDDVLYARSASGHVQRVPGRLKSIDGESVLLEFGGQNRKVSLAKVVGIILAPERSAATGDETFHETIETYGGMKIPGLLATLDEATAAFHTLWGEDLSFDTDELTGLTVQNGKVVSLTELVPSRVEQVPFFDRLFSYRVNESLSGGTIVLRDGHHSHGISVHAKTVLTYAIDGKFQRFRSKVGFQLPEGAIGDAEVRVMGDEKTLYERPRLLGEGPVDDVDVDVSGVRTLTLSVDFGRKEDVGDRVVWADPILIRSTTGPTAAADVSKTAK